MEVLTSQSVSTLYAQLAQKQAQLANIDKEDMQKSTADAYDKTSSLSKYDEQDYQRVLSKFKKLDGETKTHEQLHASNAPTTTAINYNYQVGPDGKLYATGGHVRFDTSIPEDPNDADLKLQQLQSAASAPNQLSSADAQIARVANLNRFLLLSQEQGVTNDN